MAKNKIHYYVLVITDYGPKFVTSVNNSKRSAEWNTDEKPLEMSKSEANYLALGLTWNGNTSYVVAMDYEIVSHPYNYSNWKIRFEERN